MLGFIFFGLITGLLIAFLWKRSEAEEMRNYAKKYLRRSHALEDFIEQKGLSEEFEEFKEQPCKESTGYTQRLKSQT